MNMFPDSPKKIKARIRSYERKLQEEQKEYGFINDGYGRRYLLGPLYMLINDNEGTLRSYAWFEAEFPNDVGEPLQYLCWTLALYRAGDLEAAARKLRQTMFSNLYIIPRLLGQDQEELDIWHGSNLAEKAYLEYIPLALFELWDEAALKWAQETYNSTEMFRKRERYIEIYRQLKTESPGPKRSRLVQEASKIRYAK